MRARLEVRTSGVADAAAAGAWWLVEALKAGDQFLGEGLAGLCPKQAAGDATVPFDGEGKGEQHFDVALDVLRGL